MNTKGDIMKFSFEIDWTTHAGAEGEPFTVEGDTITECHEAAIETAHQKGGDMWCMNAVRAPTITITCTPLHLSVAHSAQRHVVAQHG